MSLLFRFLGRWGGIFLIGAAAELLFLGVVITVHSFGSESWMPMPTMFYAGGKPPIQGTVSCMAVLFMAALITAVRFQPTTGFSLIWYIFIAIGSSFIMLLGVMFALLTFLLVMCGEGQGGAAVPVVFIYNLFVVVPPVVVGWGFGMLIKAAMQFMKHNKP